MHLASLVRTAAFRWALAIAGSFAALSLLLFAFVYWQTADYERAELDHAIRHEARFLIDSPAAAVAPRLDLWLAEDLHDVRFAALLDASGRRVGGNMVGRPEDLPVDGRPRFTPADVLTHDPGGDGRPETLRAAAFRLDDGRVLVLGRDLDELDHTRTVILRALALGLGPMLIVGLGVGAFLGRRALDRVAAVDRVVGRVAAGRLGERLPVRARATSSTGWRAASTSCWTTSSACSARCATSAAASPTTCGRR